MSLETVSVDLAERSYEIVIGKGALGHSADAFKQLRGNGKSVIVADETVWRLHGEKVLSTLGDMPVLSVPSGEASKCFDQYARLSEELLDTGIGRDGVIVAVGGGVTGDLAGFTAATLRRGCRFVQIPTTLLAQVDSSVGGKTAINSAKGKNLIGAFHQPALVISDTALLSTLPERELKAGYAEILKYGLLGDRSFFDWLDDNAAHVLSLDDAAVKHAVKVSCQMKADIVSQDEREGGKRALLNLGHTFGHALEAAMGYDGGLLHGEGVAVGIAMAFRYSAKIGLCDHKDAELVRAHLQRIGLPATPGDIAGLDTTAEDQLAAMYQDKKVEGGALTFILAREIGRAVVQKDVAPDQVLKFLQTEVSAPR